MWHVDRCQSSITVHPISTIGQLDLRSPRKFCTVHPWAQTLIIECHGIWTCRGVMNMLWMVRFGEDGVLWLMVTQIPFPLFMVLFLSFSSYIYIRSYQLSIGLLLTFDSLHLPPHSHTATSISYLSYLQFHDLLQCHLLKIGNSFIDEIKITIAPPHIQ